MIARARANARVSRSLRVPSAPAEVGQVVHGRGRAGQQLVRQRAQLEPLRHGVGRGQQLVRAAARRAEPGRRPAPRGGVRGTCTGSRPGSLRPAPLGRVAGGRRGGRRRPTARRLPRAPLRRSVRTGPADVPSRLLAPVTATSRVRSDRSGATCSSRSSPVVGVEVGPAHAAPAASAAISHGRMLASWSSRVTTISSPGRHCRSEGSGEVERQLGGAAAEHDAGRVGAGEVGHRTAGADDDLLGVALRGVVHATVGRAGPASPRRWPRSPAAGSGCHPGRRRTRRRRRGRGSRRIRIHGRGPAGRVSGRSRSPATPAPPSP